MRFMRGKREERRGKSKYPKVSRNGKGKEKKDREERERDDTKSKQEEEQKKRVRPKMKQFEKMSLWVQRGES